MKRLRAATAEELCTSPISPQDLDHCSVLVRGSSPTVQGEELIRSLVDWFEVWRDHHLWKTGSWRCVVGEDRSRYSSGEWPAFLGFHNDMTRYHEPPRFVAIRCLRPDRGAPASGANLLLHLDDALDRLRALGRGDLLEFLHKPRVLNAAEAPRLIVSIVPATIEEGPSRIFDRSAATHGLHVELDHGEAEMLDEFRELCRGWTDLILEIPLERGDVLFFSNHRFLHGRTACASPGRTTEIFLGNVGGEALSR